MRKVYQFTLTMAISFALLVNISHLALAQANDIKGGPSPKATF